MAELPIELAPGTRSADRDLDYVESGALFAFASLSSISSLLGVRSIGGTTDDAVAFPLSLVASSFSVALGLMMTSLVFSMLREIRPAKLVAYVAIACLAAVFDAGFYSDVFVPKRWEETREARNEQAIAQESARLSTAAAEMKRLLRNELASERKESADRRARAQADYLYETQQRDRLRGCGPRCKKAIQERASAETRLAELDAHLTRVQSIRAVPADGTWSELRSFHAELLALASAVPAGKALVLPSPPAEPAELSEIGSPLSRGGLVRVFDQGVSGEFRDPTFFIPVSLGLVTEFLGLLFVVALRRRTPLECRFGEGLSRMQSFLHQTPSPTVVARAWMRWLRGR